MNPIMNNAMQQQLGLVVREGHGLQNRAMIFQNAAAGSSWISSRRLRSGFLEPCVARGGAGQRGWGRATAASPERPPKRRESFFTEFDQIFGAPAAPKPTSAPVAPTSAPELGAAKPDEARSQDFRPDAERLLVHRQNTEGELIRAGIIK